MKTTRFSRGLALLGLMGMLLVAAPLAALTLDEARARGLVGETANGLLVPMNTGRGISAPTVRQLVDKVNRQRRQTYDNIARKRGTSVGAVQAIAADRLRGRLPQGAFYQNQQGRWVRK